MRVPSWVGVNVTLITQLTPAAKVLRQGFVLVARAKSPLTAMLVIFSVAVPVLASVTALAGEVKFTTVLAKVTAVGVRVTAGPPPPPPVQALKANDPIFVFQLKVPLTFSYWSTYQKVQSSLGSTCMAV